MKELLNLKNLQTSFYMYEGTAKAVDGISLTINQGKTLGLVGESGCGKSITALSILRLVPYPPGKIVGGEIIFKGKNLLNLTEREMRKIRGCEISMIFQEPMTSLDPVFTIGHEIMESITLHQGLNKTEAKKAAIGALAIVGIPDAEKRLNNYPHELSGGMRQRVMIAMALSCHPALLIADEPTTALDVTIQAQILRLINEMKAKINASVLLITHDLGVIAEMCDDVAVMYAGHIVEYADIDALFSNPLHPYTMGLNKSIPRLDKNVKRLDTIKGLVPNLLAMPSGCSFHPRCNFCFEKCVTESPELKEIDTNHFVKCHLY